MKKNTVITSIVLLLCLVLFGMDLSGVMAQKQAVVSSNVIGSTGNPVPVTFSEGDKRTTLYINMGSSFGGDLPSLPNETWQWMDADSVVLDGDTVVVEAMTVYASRRFQGNDFLNGVTASLFATDTQDELCEGALIAETISVGGKNQLKACLTTDPDCHPSVWSFEFVDCLQNNPNVCKYYVSSGGSYLNVTNSAASISNSKGNPLYIRNNKDGTYCFMNSAQNGALNFKKDLQEDPTGGTYYFKGTQKKYFTDAGSKIYFAPTISAMPLTLAFNVNGGNINPGPASLKTYEGAQVKLPNYTGKKDLHEFIGWSTTADGEPVTTEPFTMPAADTTLYAVYDNVPILWLDVNGGVGSLDKYYFKEGPVELPGDNKITRDGYRFSGWSEDKDAIAGEEGIIEAGTSYNIPESGDKILYAVWYRPVKIYAASSFEDEDAPECIGDFMPGEKVDLASKLSKYSIDKWFYYGRKNIRSWYHTGDQFTVPNNDVVLYGANYVKVTFDPDYGSEQTVVRDNLLTGEMIDLMKDINPSFSQDTAELIGWQENGTGRVYTQTYTAGQTDVTLKAVWKYTVTFNVVGGSAAAPSAIIGTISDGKTLPAYEGKNNGYDFAGWITVSPVNFDPANDKVYHPEESLFDAGEPFPRANTYYALYQVPVYFNLNNGTTIEGPDGLVKENNIWVYKADPGQQLDLTDFIAGGHRNGNRTFLGWALTTTEQVKISQYTVPGRQSTLYAMWGSTITFADTWFEDVILPDPVNGFKADNNDGSGKPFIISADPYRSTWVAQSPTNQSGHLFLGWTDSAAGTSVKFTPGQSYGFPKENSTYYAVWANSTRVSFDSNGGSGGNLPPTENKTSNDEIRMPGQSGMTREGYEFEGWSTAQELYSDNKAIRYNAVYKPDDIYTIPLNPPANLTFYAVWNKTSNRPPLKFGLLKEKETILREPVQSGADYDASKFTSSVGKGTDWRGNIFKTDALLTQHWVIASTPIHEPTGYYLPNEVTAAIDPDKIPSSDEIQQIAEIGGVEGGFDPATEYVVWYVIKHKTDVKWNGTDFDGDYCWHVDGVILSRGKVNINYEIGDLPTSEYDNWVIPAQKQVLKNSTTTVLAPQQKGTINNGWAFLYWVDDTDKQYRPGDPLEVKEDDVSLTAVWSHDAVDVKIQKIWVDGNNEKVTRPAGITMKLLANRKVADEYPNGITLQGTGNIWEAEVKMYRLDGGGTNIDYTWQEEGVPTVYEAGAKKDGYTTTITNTLVESSKVEKVWSDGNENHVNDTVTVQLMQKNGTAPAEKFGDAVGLTASGNWTYSTKVPVYDPSGNIYRYYWVETNTSPDYRATSQDDGYNTTITNEKYILLTITADDKSKIYGESDPALTVTGIPDGANIIYNISREPGENADEYKITVTGDEVQGIYKIDWQPGTFTIDPKPVTVTAPVLTKVYGESDEEAVAAVEGKPKTVEITCPDSESGNCLIGSDTIPYSCERLGNEDGTRTYAADGTFTDAPYPFVFTVEGEQVTTRKEIRQGNYIVTYEPGSLTITPKLVTVKANDAVKIYGENDPVWTADVSGTVNAETVEYNITRLENDDENTGRTENADGNYSDPVPHEDVIIPDGDPYQGGQNNSNYEVTYEPGDLTIEPRSLTVQAPTLSKRYGTPDSDLDWTPQVEGLIGDDEAKFKSLYSADRDDKDEDVRSAGYTIKAKGPKQLENYNADLLDGTLTITRRHLTVTSGSVTALWDGQTELVCKNADCKEKYGVDHFVLTGEDQLAEGDTLDVTITGSQSGVGSHPNRITKVSVIENTKPGSFDVPENADGRPYNGESPFNGYTTNYDIEVREGMLTLTGSTGVVITGLPQSKDYDSTPLTCIGNCIDWVSVSGLEKGDRIGSITISGSQTTANVGNPKKYVIESYTIVDKDNKDVTDKYVNVTKNTDNATLTVHPVDLTITTGTKTDFVYDGMVHILNSYVFNGLKGNDKIDPASINITGAQTNAGESSNTMVRAVRIINQDGDDVTSSYIPDYYFGRLGVKPKPVTVTIGNYQKEYGMIDPAFTAQVRGTLPGDEGKISYTITRGEGEDQGSYPIIPGGDAVQNNYAVTYVQGTLTVILNPTDQTVSKVWADDNNRDGLRPVSLGVTLTGSNGMRPVTRRLSADNNWTVTVPDLPVFYNGQRIVYEWTEDEIPGYTGTKQVNGNVTTFTNTHVISRTSASVTKIWDDKNNAGKTRPSSLGVVLQADGEWILGRTLSDENNWSLTVDNLPMNNNGRPINYVWFERSVGSGYYAVSSVTTGGSTTLVNSNLYRLTIHYRYNNGSEAHADYTDRLFAGEIFTVDSPLIAGFTANPLTVVGVMPDHNFEIIVVYAGESEEVVRQVVPREVNTETETEHKSVPTPRDTEPDADHPLVLSIPNILVDIDDLNTALGLGEVNSSNHGFALE